MTMEAGRQGRRTYPYMPDSNWWTLRRRFQQTPPRGDVDAAYLATVLNIGEAAARNLTGPLRAVGLVDENNRPTERAMAWRDDEQYRQVTGEILEAVYPQGLRDAAPPPTPDRSTVERWFLRDTRTGHAAADRMARFYLLLAAGDPAGGEQAPLERAPRPGQAATEARRPRRRRGAGTTGVTPALEVHATPIQTAAPTGTGRAQQQPSLHVDIQVHIDPAATVEQIDQIFASMARHLYGRE